jgi:chaperonin GroEL
VAIQAPAYGGRRVDELQDLAVLTGGVAVLNDSGRDLKNVWVTELGRANKVVSDRDKTIIFGAKGNKKILKGYLGELRNQLKLANTDFDKDIKEQRLAKLAGGLAVINVGAATDPEADEKRERVIDAINAVKAASEEGVVAGGEITLLKLSGKSQTPNILEKALRTPFKKLIENAGLDYGDVREDMAGTMYPMGMNIMTGKVTDLIKDGVIDPVKVVRCAIENACSVAGMLVAISCTMTEVEENEKA